MLLLSLPPNFLDYRNAATAPTAKRVTQASFKFIFGGVAQIVYICDFFLLFSFLSFFFFFTRQGFDVALEHGMECFFDFM